MSVEADELWRSFLASRSDDFDLDDERAGVAAASAEHPRRPGVAETSRMIAGLEVVVARPERPRSDLVVVWVHGGAFTVMRASSYAATAGHLAGELGCEVLVPDYPLAPEVRFPAALDELDDCYRAVLDESDDAEVVLLGDSAGAALVVGLTMRLRDRGEPLPFLSVLVCPWVDLTLTNRSLRDNAELDAVLGAAPLAFHVDAYLGADVAPDDPEASPFHGDLGDLGSFVIQAAEYDVLVDDAIRFTRRARSAGTDVELEIAAEMPHSYQFFTGVIPEADMALTRLAATIEERLGRSGGTGAGQVAPMRIAPDDRR
ncbi:MAG: alpha/beta hydrolase [Actinomycetota bacterium]